MKNPYYKKKQYCVYIMANIARTLYAGVTNNLERRVYEHKNKLVPGFTAKYGLDILVYFEYGEDIYGALTREKQIKGWRRSKKIELIESMNPGWRDLSKDWQDRSSEETSRPGELLLDENRTEKNRTDPSLRSG